LATIHAPTHLDVTFANTLARVFNEDVQRAGTIRKESELWMSLRQTQFRRAIARFSAFSTGPMVEWLLTIENSTSLRYEGSPFSACIFMSKQKKWIAEPLGNSFVSFHPPLPLKRAILQESWIRAALKGAQVGLLGVGHSGNIVGMVALNALPPADESIRFAPHEDLRGLRQLVRPGTMAFVTSKQGDVYTLFPNGAVFQKTQGMWHYLNYDALFSVLMGYISEAVADAVLRAALNLSYSKQGAILAILIDKVHLCRVVPDSNSQRRANATLRDCMAGLNITKWEHRPFILSAAGADGAVILDAAGSVLDVACMIGDPSRDDLAAAGHSELQKMPGARSTAAWNASIFGTALKISEDGPITVYQKGVEIARIG
jgi:hypothetical protein